MSATAAHAADEVSYGKYGDLSLVRYTSTFGDPDYYDSYTYHAASKVITDENSSLSGAAKHNFTADDIAGIRKVTNFEQFTTVPKNDDDVWSAATGTWINAANGGTVEWEDADISVTTDAFAVDQLEAGGLQLAQGKVNFKGASTKINAANKTVPSDGIVGGEHTAVALVIDFLLQDAIKNPSPRLVTFSSDETQLSATAEGENAQAYGIWAIPNDVSRASIEFNGENASITVASDSDANGITLERYDTDEAKSAVNPALTPDQTGYIALKSQTASVNVRGKNTIGVRVDTGTFRSTADLTLTATAAEGGSSYGVALVGYGKAVFNGPTKITAQGGTTNTALLLAQDSDIPNGLYEAESYEYGPAQTPTAIFGKTASLTGDVYAGKGSELIIAGDVTAVGNWHSEGLITGGNADAEVEAVLGNLTITGDSVYIGANPNQYESVTIDGEDQPVNVHLKSLVVNGKSVLVNSRIYAEDSITFSGGKIVNGNPDDDVSSEIDTPKFVLENGAELDNYGGLHAPYIKIGQDAVYYEADDEFEAFKASDGSTALRFAWSDDTVELAGGRLSNIGDGSLTNAEGNPIALARGLEIKSIALQEETTGSSVSQKNAKLVVSAGDYAFDDLTLNLEKGAVEVTGGTLEIGTMNAANGTVSVTGGTLDVGTFNVQTGTVKTNVSSPLGTLKTGAFNVGNGAKFTLTGGILDTNAINTEVGSSINLANSTIRLTADKAASSELRGEIKSEGDNYGRLIIGGNGTVVLGGEADHKNQSQITINEIVVGDNVVVEDTGETKVDDFTLVSGTWSAHNGHGLDAKTWNMLGGRYVTDDADEIGDTLSVDDGQTMYLHGTEFVRIVDGKETPFLTLETNVGGVLHVRSNYEFENVVNNGGQFFVEGYDKETAVLKTSSLSLK